MIFNYINEEINERKLTSIAKHIENCEKCKTKYFTLQEKIKLVNSEFNLLKPMIIPQKPFVVPSGIFKDKKYSIRNVIESYVFTMQSIKYKKAITIPILVICLFLVFVLQKKTQPDYGELSKHIAVIEQSFIADPKQALNENCFFVTSFDEEKKQIEILQKKSDTGKNISRNTIKLQ